MDEPADLASVAARLGAALRAEGVPVGPERAARFARAVMLAAPATSAQLRWCATATLACDPAHLPVVDRLLRQVLAGYQDSSGQRGGPTEPSITDSRPAAATEPPAAEPPEPAGRVPSRTAPDPTAADLTADPASRGGPRREPARTSEVPVRGAAAERLAHRDFAGLSTQELATLAAAMRRLRLAVPLRRSRRTAPAARGSGVDLRATLRQAGRTAGHPVRLRRRRPRYRPRRLVVLCDISGSMAPYARAMLQLLYCAAGANGSEVFSFATRLTRLSPQLRRLPAAVALERAGRAAPDWSGGTRIAASLKEFTDRYGARGMARGAVVVIVSDGWETGDPARLGAQMARLSRLAYRIVWANPRTAGARYRPLAGGMAAAWPFCDAVVSAHSLAALDDLLAALRRPYRPAQ